MDAPQYALGRAAAQRVQNINMPLGCEHHEIGTPVRLSFEDFVYDLTLSYDCFKRPSAAQRQIYDGRRPIVSCNVN